MNNISRTKLLAASGLIIALDVVSARFLFFYTPGMVDRISLQFLANALAGAMFGPLWAAVCCVAADVIGMFMNSGGLTFMPLITLACAARGVLYGLLLHRRELSLPRAILAVGVVTAVVELGMMPAFLSILYGNGWWATLVAKVPVRLCTIPVYGLVIYTVSRALAAARLMPAPRRREKKNGTL